MQNDLSKEVMDVAEEQGLEVSLVDEAEFRSLITRIEGEFLDNRRTFPLWERMRDPKAQQAPDAWRSLDELIGNRKIVIFFEQDRDKRAVLLASGKDASQVLSECTGFVFYLTDLSGSYLVAFNDHDMLLSLGDL